jgi:hypothetical protein
MILQEMKVNLHWKSFSIIPLVLILVLSGVVIFAIDGGDYPVVHRYFWNYYNSGEDESFRSTLY